MDTFIVWLQPVRSARGERNVAGGCDRWLALRDARNGIRAPYDVVIVGLGISAGPVVDYFLRHRQGYRILIVDRGEFRDYREIEQTVDANHRHDPGVADSFGADPFLFRDSDSNGDVEVPKWWLPRTAGGGSLVWYGQLSRFRRSDFALGVRRTQLVRDSQARDWPIKLETLVPYYEQVERILLPFGSAYGYSAREYLEFDCSQVLLRPHTSELERRLIDRLQRAGLRPYVGQTCLGGRAWEHSPVDPLTLRRLSTDAPLAHRANWYRRNYDTLAARDDVDGLDASYVKHLVVSDGRLQAVVVRGIDSSADTEIAARYVVLAAGTLETLRILLSSGLPNRNGLLGRRLTFSTERNAYLVTNIRRSPKIADWRIGMFSAVIVKDFYDPPDNSTAAKAGKVAIYDARAAELPEKYAHNLRLTGSELAAALAQERQRYVLKLSFKGESIPWEQKYLELSDRCNRVGAKIPRVHYAKHTCDIDVENIAVSIFERIAAACGGGDLLIQPPKHGAGLVSAHQHGGAVFGADASDAVLNEYCECFEALNVFVVDGAFMPTSGGTNSSLTLMANASRVAQHVGCRLEGT